MNRFNSAKDAYAWAWEIWDARRSGRAFVCDPDFMGNAGLPKDYQYLEGLQIKIIADKYDITEGGVSWFECHLLPMQDDTMRPYVAGKSMERLTKAIDAFACAICEKGYLTKCRADCVKWRSSKAR